MDLQSSIEAGMHLDGYGLIQIIGQGGFGQVWLSRSSFTGELKAIKVVQESRAADNYQEFKGLVAYKEKALWLRSEALVPVEHANSLGTGFFYVMPLADPLFDGIEPGDASWKPKTLGACLDSLRESGTWLTSEQIKYLLLQLIAGCQILEEAGLVHRDIKPENVLFLGGKPALGDCGLVGPDKIALTRRGTPGYAAPGYYLDGGGSPDMYGLGALLYILLTGRNPDSSNLSARRAYWWPPAGEESLSDDENREWSRLRNVVLTALDEERRFSSLAAFADAVGGTVRSESPLPATANRPGPAPRMHGALTFSLLLALVALLAVGIWFYVQPRRGAQSDTVRPGAETTPASSGIPSARLAELNAIIAEGEGKVDAFKKANAERFRFSSALDSLNGIDAKSADADQQLSTFLSRFGNVRIPKPLQPQDHAGLTALFSYVGRIYDWGKTDQEKELADIRSRDFDRQLGGPLNDFNESQSAGITAKLILPLTIKKLESDRGEAAKARELNMQPNQVAEEEAKAADFTNRLQAWYQHAQGN